MVDDVHAAVDWIKLVCEMSCHGRSQGFFYRGGGKFDPKGLSPSPAGPRAEVGFLGRGSQPPPQQLVGLGSDVSSPDWVRGGATAAGQFPCVLSVQSGISRQFSVLYCSL